MRTGKIKDQIGTSEVGGFIDIAASLPGSVFVVPHYDSGTGKDTEITINNSSEDSVRVHLFFISPAGVLSQNTYVTIVAGESEQVKASVIDSGNTGLVLGVASDGAGKFISFNYLTASIRYYDTDYDGSFSAFTFKALVEETSGATLLNFNGLYLEPQPYSVSFLNVRSDSFVAFAKLNGVLATGLDLITSLNLKTQSLSGQGSVFLNPRVCQVSGVLSTLYPSLVSHLSTDPIGRLFANCSFAMIINKGTTAGKIMDDGSRVSSIVTIPVIP